MSSLHKNLLPLKRLHTTDWCLPFANVKRNKKYKIPNKFIRRKVFM